MKMKNLYTKRVMYFGLFLLLAMLATMAVVFALKPSVHTAVNAVTDSKVNQAVRLSGLPLLKELVINNALIVPLQMLVFALLPIPYLYVIQPLITFCSVGVLYGIGFVIHPQNALLIILSSSTHNLVEMFAYCLVLAALYPLNKWVCSWVWHHKRSRQHSFFAVLKQVFKRWLIYSIPVFLVAAVLETYLDPWISSIL